MTERRRLKHLKDFHDWCIANRRDTSVSNERKVTLSVIDVWVICGLVSLITGTMCYCASRIVTAIDANTAAVREAKP